MGSTLGEVSGPRVRTQQKRYTGYQALGDSLGHNRGGVQWLQAGCIHLPRKGTIPFPFRPSPAPFSALVSCLPIQGHDLFLDENVYPPYSLWPLARATRRPYWEKGGPKEPSLAERRQVLGGGSQSGLTFALLFVLTDID